VKILPIPGIRRGTWGAKATAFGCGTTAATAACSVKMALFTFFGAQEDNTYYQILIQR